MQPLQKLDRTFHDVSLYGSDHWCAATLGQSFGWFKKHVSNLEDGGFPKPDPILGQRIKADVEVWISRRRKFSDKVDFSLDPKPMEISLENL